MPNILIYNKSDGSIINYLVSVDEQSYIGRDDVLIHPALPTNSDRSFWKVDAGVLREWTQAEKDAKTASDAASLSTYLSTVNTYLDGIKNQFNGLSTAITTRQGQINVWPGTPTLAWTDAAVKVVAQDIVDLATLINNLRPMLETLAEDYKKRITPR